MSDSNGGPFPLLVKGEQVTDAMRRAWALSGRPDPLDGEAEAWAGFGLAVAAALEFPLYPSVEAPTDEPVAPLGLAGKGGRLYRLAERQSQPVLPLAEE